MSNYLQRRNAVYYFQRRIPTHLAVNRNQVLKWSLKTRCYNKAKILADIVNYEVSIGFIKGEVLTGKKFYKIIEKFEKKSLKEYSSLEELRHVNHTVRINNKNYEGSTAGAVLYHLKKFREIDDHREFERIKDYVDSSVIQNTNMDKEKIQALKDFSFDEFYWRLFKQQKAALKQDAEKFLGGCEFDTVNQLIEKLNGYISLSQVKPVVVDQKNDVVISDDFKTIVEKYLDHRIKKKEIKKSTVKDYLPCYMLIDEVFPNICISKLTTENLEELETIIYGLPTYRKNKKILKSLNVKEQVDLMHEIDKERRSGIFNEKYEKINFLNEKTQNRYFEQISHFIDYCSRKYKFLSPLNGIALARNSIKQANASNERLLLSDNELAIIFNSFEYMCSNLMYTLVNDPIKIFGPFLTLYLGIRPQEVVQLMLDDVKETIDSNEEPIFYLHVTEENLSDDRLLDEIKSQKTPNSGRKIPLTRIFLEELHFLEFVSMRKRNKQKFLFLNSENIVEINEELINCKRRCESVFNNAIKNMNFEDLEKKSYYSMRHSFANKIKHITETLDNKRGETLMGHAGATNTEFYNRYGNKYFDPVFLYDILEKVEYEGVCLDKFKENIRRLLNRDI